LRLDKIDKRRDNKMRDRYNMPYPLLNLSSFSRSVTKIASIALFLSFLLMSSSLASPLQEKDARGYAQVPQEEQQRHQENQQENENKSHTQIFGCADFGESFHCDPFLNELITYRMIGNWSIISPVVNDHPQFVNFEKKGDERISTSNQPAQDGKALDLPDKSREFVHIPGIDNYVSGQFSVSFNLKNTTSSSFVGHVVSHINKEQTTGWFFDIRPSESSSTSPSPQGSTTMESGHTLSFGISNNSSEITSTKRVPVSESSAGNIVGTFDGTFLKLYKDGKLLDTTKYKGTYTEDSELPVHIGSAAYCSSCNRWSGVINDLRIYNKTLSQNEITNTILVPSTTMRSESVDRGIVGHWPLEGNLNDVSAAHNHGIMITPMASMVFAPDGKLFYSEKNTGEIRIMKDNRTLAKPFATISDIYVDWEQGLLGLTIDPNYDKNRFVYAYYTAINDQSDDPFNRVVRFVDNNNTGTDMKVIIDNIPALRGFHSGGGLAFGPDDKLYITVGDATMHEYAQDPSIPIGKTLRINRDGTIPEDNPFPNSAVYTLGHRNMFGIAFDWSSGTGILTENGDQAYDEVNLIQKGGNYGFPLYQPANVPPELSNSSESIKPLRSYFQTIAPTQALYYTGDKYPFLNGKFLFGTYTGSIHALTIQNVGTKKQLLEEDHIRLRIVPFDAVNSIAASPNGDIYFGGFYIYKLDTVGVAQKKQDTFSVVATSSPNVGFGDVQGSNDADYFYANIEIENNKSSVTSQPSFASFKIPTRFLPGINSVTYTTTDENNKQVKIPANFTVDESNPSFTNTRVQLPQNITETLLFINGSGKRDSQSESRTLNLYDDFENGTYTLREGEISPDKKWLNIFSDGGNSGVRGDLNNTSNKVFFVSPRIAKSVGETYSNLMTTTGNFSNFEMSVDLKTEKQIRENTPPKPWETVWVYFRYTDDFHYYWFVLKPTGIELGKKDCDTCTNPFEGQVFLHTDEMPVLKLGEWYNWGISAIGNNITVSLNGTELIDLTDFDMSPQLASGSVGFYAEEANVAVDNFRIEEISPKK
jgi:glucose/arabinose dehydrogenase